MLCGRSHEVGLGASLSVRIQRGESSSPVKWAISSTLRSAIDGPSREGLTASSLNLTQYDIEEVQEHCGGRFNHREIQSLYKRFRNLDKQHKGYISEDELLNIPELAISPLASRIVQVFQNINFKVGERWVEGEQYMSFVGMKISAFRPVNTIQHT